MITGLIRRTLIAPLLLAAGIAHAGGSYEFEPTFMTGRYIHPENSPGINFDILLDIYFPESGEQDVDHVDKLHSELSAWAREAGYEFRFIKGTGEAGIQYTRTGPAGATIHTGDYYYDDSCNANGFSTHKMFARHLLAAKYPMEETAAILATRLGMIKDCNDFPLHAIQDDRYRDNSFARYILASRSFYADDLDAAFSDFSSLLDADNPWVKETAAYMLGRIRLIQAQNDWDGYDTPTRTVDQTILAQSAQLFADYLSRYPDGAYAHSAKNLRRRIVYLRGENERLYAMVRQHVLDTLAEATQSELAPHEKARRVREAFLELDLYGGGTGLDTPLLLSSRVYADAENSADVEEIERHADSFSAYPGLLELTKATLAYRKGDFGSVVQTDATDGMPAGIVGGFVVLRALSHEALGQPEEALSEWQRLLTGQEVRDDDLLLGLARNYEALDRIEELAKKDNAINRKSYENRTPLFRKVFGESCASDKLLAIANDAQSETAARDAARAALLERYLLSGAFGKASHYLEALDVKGDYGAIQTALRTLAENPDDPKGLLNIAYFLNVSVSAPELGTKIVDGAGNCTGVDWEAINGPLYYYHRVVQLHGDDDKTIDEAKALHYLVMCRKSGENERACSWGRTPEDLPEAKNHFDRLHGKYAGSKWAKKTPYYY